MSQHTLRPHRVELTRIRWLKRLLRWRGFQFTLVTTMLAFFVVAVIAGLWGTPVGNRNFGLIFVWLVWWALLILILVPVAGRFWCSMCPLPVPGEWLQRQALVAPRRAPFTLGKRWPRRLKNLWLQNAGFLLFALFSAVILTRPNVTAVVLLGLAALAVVLSLIFERRVFCRYVCPIGGFIGLYSMTAPIELRVKDTAVCAGHKEKSCYVGNEQGFGCPWLAFPGGLVRNTTCGLCTECLKTCPLDNVAIYLRPPGADLFVAKERRLDEAYKALIMLTCALVYAAILIGPWAELKAAANFASLPRWGLYAASFLTLNLAAVPGLFFLATAAARRLGGIVHPPRRETFAHFAYALAPLGLAAWVAFTLAFVLVNISYAVPLLSDPFGWGWNLLGTADARWTPLLAGALPYLQTAALTVGLVAAIVTAYRIACEQTATPSLARRATWPLAAFCSTTTLLMLWLLLG